MKVPKIYVFCLLSFLCISYGCTRCIKCSEFDAKGKVVYDYPETCGKKKDIEALQTQITENKDPGKTAECTMRR